jgi:hypothetical protein
VKPLWRPQTLAIALFAAGVSLPGAAQSLPSEPITFGGGRITLAGDVSATFSCTDSPTAESPVCADDTGFFNYTDYEHSTMRMLRIGVAASIRVSDRLAVLSEVRTEDLGQLQPYALFVRIRPWREHRFDVQAGRVPPVFGAFARRTYPADNPLIGYPLAYQYLTSLRADALPANADELLRMRGRGWLSNFSVGELTADRGLPIVSAFRWDTGVQVHAGNERVDSAVGVTTGSLSNPLVGDDNAGKQIAGRVALTPTAGLVIGVSAARGPYVTRETSRIAGTDIRNGSLTQTAVSTDLEFSRGYYVFRFEGIFSDWRVPRLASPYIDAPLRASSLMVEGRYKIRPGLFAAARFDHLGFSEITGSSRTAEWEAPVTRVEVGAGYSPLRNLLLKGSFQHNERPGGRTTRLKVGAAQVVFWF